MNSRRNFLKLTPVVPLVASAAAVASMKEPELTTRYGLIGARDGGQICNPGLFHKIKSVINGDTGEDLVQKQKTGVLWVDDRDNTVGIVNRSNSLYVEKTHYCRHIEVDEVALRITVWFK